MKLTRRSFLITSTAAAAAAAAKAAEKTTDGGFAEVSNPGIPVRRHNVLPPGASSETAFKRKCVGCQLCVKACPNNVLRPAKGLNFARPEMGFDKGWCRPECVKCSQTCPAGAIRRITIEEKKNIRTGCAVFDKNACIAAKDGTHCTVCSRHCPQKAITLIPLEPGNPDSASIPVVDQAKCTGCGCCENLCPARPMPGLHVEGYTEHRETHPVAAAIEKPSPSPVWQGLRQA